MEYADEGDLLQKINVLKENNQRFDEEEILSIFIQVV